LLSKANPLLCFVWFIPPYILSRHAFFDNTDKSKIFVTLTLIANLFSTCANRPKTSVLRRNYTVNCTNIHFYWKNIGNSIDKPGKWLIIAHIIEQGMIEARLVKSIPLEDE